MTPPIDREGVRGIMRRWSEKERRILGERMLEQVPDALLGRLLEGLVGKDLLAAQHVRVESLAERVAAHVAATRRGAFLGEYVLRNRHGEREPWQTHAWVAATAHLFDLALDAAQAGASAELLASLRGLVELVEEVDERTDELVVFEENWARLHFDLDVRRAERLLSAAPPG